MNVTEPGAASATYRVTAIVSTYKAEGFIRGCMEDLVGQSLFKRGGLEIIVVDGGSPENEKSIVLSFQEKYGHIVYVRTPECEPVYHCWNRAIRLARGEYLTNANTDDRHRPDAYDVLVGFMDDHPDVGLVYADSLETYCPNEQFATTQTTRRTVWPRFQYEGLRRVCYIGPHPMWRKSLHDTYGFFDERFASAGDYEFWLRVGKTETFSHYPDVLGLYYNNPHGIENSYGRNAAETNAIQRAYCNGVSGNPYGSMRMVITTEELGQLRGRSNKNVQAFMFCPETIESMSDLVTNFRLLTSNRMWREAHRLTEIGIERFGNASYPWVLNAISHRSHGRLSEATEAVTKSLKIGETPDALMEAVNIAVDGKFMIEAAQTGEYLKSRYPEWKVRCDERLRSIPQMTFSTGDGAV